MQEVKYIPVYKMPINMCTDLSVEASCDLLKGKDDFEKFAILTNCVSDLKAFVKSKLSYIKCLENNFDKGE